MNQLINFRLLYCLVAITSIVYFCCSCSSNKDGSKSSNRELVKNCFEEYKTAVTKRDGIKARSVADKETISFYDRVIKHARFSTKSELNKAGLSEKLIVFSVRQNVPLYSVRNFSGDQLFAYMISNGLIDNSTMSFIDLGEIELINNAAQAPVIVGGQKAPFTLRFKKEKGIWKINISSLLIITDLALTGKINQAGLTEELFIDQLLNKKKGYKGSKNRYWEPLY